MSNVNVKFWSACPRALSDYTLSIEKVFQECQVVYSKVNLPKKKQRLTVLKSPHVNKKAKEQFEIRTYKVVFFITGEQFDLFIIKGGLSNRPSNISMSVKVLEG